MGKLIQTLALLAGFSFSCPAQAQNWTPHQPNFAYPFTTQPYPGHHHCYPNQVYGYSLPRGYFQGPKTVLYQPVFTNPYNPFAHQQGMANYYYNPHTYQWSQNYGGKWPQQNLIQPRIQLTNPIQMQYQKALAKQLTPNLPKVPTTPFTQPSVPPLQKGLANEEKEMAENQAWLIQLLDQSKEGGTEL